MSSAVSSWYSMIASPGCAGSSVIFNSAGLIGCQSSKAWSRADGTKQTASAIRDSRARNMDILVETLKVAGDEAVYTPGVGRPQGDLETSPLDWLRTGKDT